MNAAQLQSARKMKRTQTILFLSCCWLSLSGLPSAQSFHLELCWQG